MELRNHWKIWWLFACLALMTAACNNDIFVENTTPGMSEVKIDGDGGCSTVRFQPKGLERIMMDAYGNTPEITVYDSRGSVIPYESPACEVARINCTTHNLIFDVAIDGDLMTFTSTECSAKGIWNIIIRLDYGHTVEFIDVEVTAGAPMEVVSFEYDMTGMQTAGNAQVTHGKTTYNNMSDYTWNFDFRPYLNHAGHVLLEPDGSWARFLEMEDLEIPTRLNGEWGLWGHTLRLRMGSAASFTPVGFDTSVGEPVDIPPGYSAEVMCAVTYDSARVPFSMVCRNPVSGREFSTSGLCTVMQAASYNINIQYNEISE